jgi:hypothetical protein
MNCRSFSREATYSILFWADSIREVILPKDTAFSKVKENWSPSMDLVSLDIG